MKKSIKSLLIIFLLFVFCNIVVFAEENNSEINLSEITDQDRIDLFSENISLRIEEKEPKKMVIKTFDVNENGMIAILHPVSFGRYYIRIINSDGVFYKAFSYKYSAESAIRWVGDNLQIFAVRGGIAFTVDMDANIISLADISQDKAWHEYLKEELEANEKTVGKATYQICTDYGILDYIALNNAKLVVTSENGTETLYDVNKLGFIRIFVCVCAIIAFCLILLKKCYSSFKSYK